MDGEPMGGPNATKTLGLENVVGVVDSIHGINPLFFLNWK